MSRRYLINQNYFKSIDTEEKAYILGFLFADGYVNLKNNSLELTLNSDDISILIKIRDLIFPKKDKPILPIKNGLYQRLTISCKEIVNDLITYGCVQRKTFLLKFPNLSNSLVRHFIRGYFDGDGSVFLGDDGTTLNISVVGTIKFLNSLQKILIKNLHFRKTKLDIRHPERKNNIRSLRYGGNILMNRFFHYLYDDSNLFLERKKEVFDSILKTKKYRNNKTHTRNFKKKRYNYDGKVWLNESELARHLSAKIDLLPSSIRRRLQNNWTITEIISNKKNQHRDK